MLLFLIVGNHLTFIWIFLLPFFFEKLSNISCHKWSWIHCNEHFTLWICKHVFIFVCKLICINLFIYSFSKLRWCPKLKIKLRKETTTCLTLRSLLDTRLPLIITRLPLILSIERLCKITTSSYIICLKTSGRGGSVLFKRIN